MRKLLRAIALTVQILITVSTLSAVEFEPFGSISTGGAERIVEPLASASLNIPFYSESGSYNFESGYSRPFGVKELDQSFLAGSVRVGKFNLALGLSQLGQTDYYAEKLIKSNLVYRLGAYNLSIAYSHLSYHFGFGFDGLSVSTLGFGLGTNFRKTSIALSGDNLQLGKTHQSIQLQEQLSLNIEQKFSSRSRFLFRGKFESGQKPIFGIGQILNISSQGSIEYGVGTSPLRIGGGIRLNLGQTLVSVGFSKHPVLGLSKVISISYLFKRDKSSKGKAGV